MKILKKEEAEKLFCHRCLASNCGIRMGDAPGMLYPEWAHCVAAKCMAWHDLKDGAGYCSDLGRSETDTEHEIDILKRKLAMAEELLEKIKCCGNCEHYHDGLINPCLRLEQNLWTNAGCYCDHWQYDGLTAKQRKAGIDVC